MAPGEWQHHPPGVGEKGTGCWGERMGPSAMGRRGLWDIHKAGPQQAAVYMGLKL